ncbi:hypothetical protein [uncultured Ruegeria sp.]|uniref:hypothetical protein n=1 Tax=uncultured Ruegeria sp. TaxID=259304 RepID=UPI0026329905|nr:hypothetical protein [uncultured Ruegeria sp.]
MATDLNEIGGKTGNSMAAKIAPQGQDLVRLRGVFHGSKRFTGMRAYPPKFATKPFHRHQRLFGAVTNRNMCHVCVDRVRIIIQAPENC